MSFTNEKADLGGHVRIMANNKGTSRPGIPAAIALMSKDQTAPAVENPATLKTSGSKVRGLGLLKKRKLTGVKV